MSKYRSHSHSFTLDETYYIVESQQINLAKLLKQGMQLNGAHEEVIQTELGINLLGSNQTWVITQYQILQWDTPQVGTELEITTRIVDLNPFFVTRRHGIEGDGVLFYEFYTQFAAIDINKRKIARLKIPENRGEVIDKSYDVKFNKLKPSYDDSNYQTAEIRVLPSDIDENVHVNNLVYIRWAAEQFPIDFLDRFNIHKIEVKYDKEILPEEDVVLHSHFDEESKVSQQIIYNLTQDKRAAIIEIHWNRKEETN